MNLPTSRETATDQRPGRLRRALGFGWRWGLRPVLAVAALVIVLVLGVKAFHAARAATMSEGERLAEDLARLERIVGEVHPAPYRNGDRAEIEAAIARAGTAIERLEAGALDREAVLAHFYEVVTRLRDPHTFVADRYEHFGMLRVAFAFFGDELRLVGAPTEVDLGARVLAIDGMEVAAAVERLRPLVEAPHESGFRDLAPRVLRTPGLLRHAGVARSAAEVELRLARRDGTEALLRLPRITLEAYRAERPVAFENEPSVLPLYRRERPEPCWYEPLDDDGALYLRFAFSAEFADERLAEIAREALAVRAERGLDTIVVDLRGNPGGNPQAHIPLVAALAATPDARGPRNLRVLVDRGTFSAAVVAASDLERRTGGLLVGEEPGDRAWLTTDARPFTLRHSELAVWVPNARMHSPGGAGGRTRLIPERPVELGFDDWLAGRDPALAAALEPYASPASNGAFDPEGLEPAAAAAEPPAPLPSGRFLFDRHRTLTLAPDGGGYRARVTGLGEDRVLPGPEGWQGGIYRGLRASADGGLESLRLDGSWEAVPPRKDPSPLELARSGEAAAATAAYLELTGGGADRALVASLALVNEGVYRYAEGEPARGRVLFDIARTLSPADPLIPLQHALLRRAAEGGRVPPADEFLRALAACRLRLAQAEIQNDWWLCL